MRWYLNPATVTNAVRDTRRVIGGGGPRRIRLTGVGRPEGLIFPTSPILMEVEARDGSVTRIAPHVPLPWLGAWGYRLSDWLARHLRS